MKFQTLHHVNIVVDDIDKASHFYAEILGLPVIDDRGDPQRPGGHFVAANSQIHLTLGEPLPGRGQHFALEVADYEETIQELENLGVSVITSRDPQRRQVAIDDPAGNRIEIREAVVNSY